MDAIQPSHAKPAEERGKTSKTNPQPEAQLDEAIEQTVRLWRKHHLGYDQTKYVVEQARRRLALQAPRQRKRTVERLDMPEVERLIQAGYRRSSKHGLMVKTLFLTGARVEEFLHIRAENLFLGSAPPQIHISHAKRQSTRYVPILPSLAQELQTHLNGRRMTRELNKGEASHDLSRFLCFGKEGTLRGREFEDQVHTFSCLAVLHNAVVAWNIQRMGQTVEALRREGHSIADADLAQVTPLMRKHINPFGKYHFDLSRIRRA